MKKSILFELNTQKFSTSLLCVSLFQREEGGYTIMNTRIILIRHAQSIKNLKDIHGGSGESLTDCGILQAEKLANSLLELGVDQTNSVLIYPPNLQVVETAAILMNKIGLYQEVIEEFKPLDLGIISGLSNKEVELQFPECFLLMKRWRNKEIEICDLAIPGMENPLDFYKRGQVVLEKIQHKKNNIFLCTNSLYILLLNILLGNTPNQGDGYKHFNIQNCGMTLFEENINEKSFYLNQLATNVADVSHYFTNKSTVL